MKADLPFTSALSPLAREQGFDLTSLALAEIEFERKYAELKQWLANTRSKPMTLPDTLSRDCRQDDFCRCRKCKPGLAMPFRPAPLLNRAVLRRLGLTVSVAIAGERQ